MKTFDKKTELRHSGRSNISAFSSDIIPNFRYIRTIDSDITELYVIGRPASMINKIFNSNKEIE